MTNSTPRALASPARRLRGAALATLAALMAALAAPCAAAPTGDAARGAAIARQGADGAAACQTCHGPAGEGNAAAGFPRLAGLPSAYLLRQLQAFAAGERHNELMAGVAKALAPADRAAAADYYASLDAPAAPAAPAASATPAASAVPAAAAASAASGPAVAASRGAVLASAGRWSDGLPACEQCHAPGGRGVGADFAALAGQPAAYLASQLRAWKAGTRPAGRMGLMSVIARKLSDADIDSLAGHFAALPARGAAR